MALAAVPVLLLPNAPVVAYANADLDHIPAPRVVEAPPTSTSTSTSISVTGPSAFSTMPASVLASLSATTAPSPAPKTVFLIGDSGAYDMEPALDAGFSAEGSKVISVAYAIIGLTIPAGIRASWADLSRPYDPDLFIVSLGTWDDEFIAEHGVAAYEAEVDDTVAMLTAHGGHVLWLSVLPSDEALPDGRARPDAQARIFAALPHRYPDLVDFIDISAPFLAPDGSTPRSIDGRLMRKPDGWHLCADGAAAVVHLVLGHLGLDGDGWDHGAWRDDRRFDNPPGGCAR
jgi:hypothetical protein